MKIDLYHLRRYLHFTSFAHPIVLDVLRVWAESLGWDVRVSPCREANVDLSTDADVVGISVYTQTAPASYRLGDKFRQKGKVVILGGPHFRRPALYEEASHHCDVVASSISEEQWKNLLKDIAAGKILPNRQKALYIVDRGNRFRYPSNFYEAFRRQKWYQISSVPTSIGCPYDCSFCSPYMQGKYILRDIQTICDEVAHTRGRMVFLSDATFGLHKVFTIELMKALAPLEKKILVETPPARLQDKAILDAMALGGVKWITVGVETLALKLEKHGTADLEEDLKRAVDRAHERGMLVQGNLICGMDCDGPESFDQIYQFYRHSNLDTIMIGVLTPYPTTKIFDQLQRERRILDTNWERYDCHHVVYRPRRMTVDELIDGYIQLYRRVSNGRFMLGEGLKVFRNNGIRAESAIVVSYNLYSRFDARRKKRSFRQDQIQMARRSWAQ